MQFLVTIDAKVWEKAVRRLERKGVAGPAAEVLEALLSTALMDEAPPTKHVGDTTITSTTIMLTLGRIKVELIKDDSPQRRDGR